MTQDEIIEMAKQCGIVVGYPKYQDIEAFATLVAAAEREAIIDLVAMYGGPVDLEAAIRTRGQA